jgi:hydroxyacyl-ACP dehydratase HTD2-like protein with hotdog domain
MLEIDHSIIGEEFDHTVFDPVRREDILEYIAATSETELPANEAADLLAPPTFVVRLRGLRFMPSNLPKDLRVWLDAGKDIEFGAPVRVGDVLTASSTVHDIFEKTGRSGSMKFLVLRTVITNQREQQVAVVDQKMMFR